MCHLSPHWRASPTGWMGLTDRNIFEKGPFFEKRSFSKILFFPTDIHRLKLFQINPNGFYAQTCIGRGGGGGQRDG